jgi:hypothetical protein
VKNKNENKIRERKLVGLFRPVVQHLQEGVPLDSFLLQAQMWQNY